MRESLHDKSAAAGPSQPQTLPSRTLRNRLPLVYFMTIVVFFVATLYAATRSGLLHQIAAPDVAPTLYAMTATGDLMAIRATDGKMRWQTVVSPMPNTIDAVDGLVITVADATLTAYRATDGSLRWQTATLPDGQPLVLESTPLYANGMLFGIARDGQGSSAFAIDAFTGEIHWHAPLTGQGNFYLNLMGASLVLAQKSDLSTSASTTTARLYLYSLDMTTGITRWSVLLDNAGTLQATVSVNALIVAIPSLLMAYDLDTGTLKWTRNDEVTYLGSGVVIGATFTILVKTAAAAFYLASYNSLDGTTRFNQPVDITTSATLVVIDDHALGLIHNGVVQAFDISLGTPLWNQVGILPSPAGTGVALQVGDGQVVAVTESTAIDLASATGRVLWSLPWSPHQHSVPPIVDVRSGSDYLAAGADLAAVRAADGALQWRLVLPAPVVTDIQMSTN